MKKAKEFLDLFFWAIIIVLGFIVIVEIGTEAYKNIKVSSKLKDDDVCIYINNELFCRKDYNIKFEYEINKA